MGLMNRIRDGVSDFTTGHGAVERLASASGYSVNERRGNVRILKFGHRTLGERRLYVTGDSSLLIFSTYSSLVLPSRNVPEEVLGALLIHNYKLSIGGWGVGKDDDGDIVIRRDYTAFTDGLDGDKFKYVCDAMIEAGVEFDLGMRKAGLL